MEVNVGNAWKVEDLQSPVRADKVIFLACMVTCCVFGFFFHKFCNPRKCSPTTRHTISFCVGYLIAFLCYGARSGHLLAMSSTVYLLLHIFSPKRAFWTSFLFCLTYSSWAHLYRMKFDYGGYSADVSLPLMVLVQRLTLLTANLLDGHEMVSDSKREIDDGEGSVHSNGHPSKDLIIPRLTPIRKEYAVLRKTVDRERTNPVLSPRDSSNGLEGFASSHLNAVLPVLA